jgi:surface polysaccharide O-acyltransferase-like enzyme
MKFDFWNCLNGAILCFWPFFFLFRGYLRSIHSVRMWAEEWKIEPRIRQRVIDRVEVFATKWFAIAIVAALVADTALRVPFMPIIIGYLISRFKSDRLAEFTRVLITENMKPKVDEVWKGR